MAAARIIAFEKAVLTTGLILLVFCFVALIYVSVAMGVQLPGRVGQVEPTQLGQTSPFDAPGVRQVGPNAYEVVVIGYAWGYTPRDIRVPVGADITFISTSRDVIHGLNVERTRVNMMLIPGQISVQHHRFREPGEHLLICHEFCGIAHHAMYGRVFVVPADEFELPAEPQEPPPAREADPEAAETPDLAI